ncbi:acyltransferase family protein [Cellvibrio sp.]|uniref:acyltransferase family protein n=1 Tax=Cellvibrio sp. TaxID=1965322 RepID=UPI003964880F
MQYRNDIQGLRAIAILLVIAAHFGIPGFSWGFVGVDVFFVISGYLITGLIYSEIKNEGNFSFLSFYARRILRLLPNLIFMILVVLGLGALLLTPNEQIFNSHVAIYASFWLSNFYFALTSINYFDNSLSSSPFLHTWSLGVEEQFYLFWPAIFLLAFTLTKRASIASQLLHKFLLFAIPILSLGYCIYLSFNHPNLAYYMMPSRLWQFCLGAAGYFIFSSPSLQSIKITPSLENLVTFVGIGLFVASAFFIAPDKQYPGYLALLPSLAALLLLIGYSGSSFTHKILGSYIFRKLGDISYSIYLWHWPAWVLSGLFFSDQKMKQLIIALIATAILSVLSFVLIESPIRRSQSLKSKPVAVLLGAIFTGLVVFSICILLEKSARREMQITDIVKYEKIRDTKPDIYAFGCDQWYSSAEVRPCVIGKSDSTHSVVLFGDSIGAQWFPAIFNIYNVPDWKIYVFTKSSCPIVDEKIFYTRIGREYTECEKWRNSAVDSIASLHPDVIFIGSALQVLTQDQWQNGTRRIINKLAHQSEQIFIFRSTPELPYNAIDCLIRKKSVANFIRNNSLCEPTVNNSYNSDVFTWLTEATKDFPNVRMLDLNNHICPNGICELEKDNQVIFRDNKHLTVEFINSATDSLFNAMTSQN